MFPAFLPPPPFLSFSLFLSPCLNALLSDIPSTVCWVWCVRLNLDHSALWLRCEWRIILFILMHHRNPVHPGHYIHPLIGLMSVISRWFLCQTHFCSTDGVQNMWELVMHAARDGFITDTRKSADHRFRVELLQFVGLHQGAPSCLKLPPSFTAEHH